MRPPHIFGDHVTLLDQLGAILIATAAGVSTILLAWLRKRLLGRPQPARKPRKATERKAVKP